MSRENSLICPEPETNLVGAFLRLTRADVVKSGILQAWLINTMGCDQYAAGNNTVPRTLRLNSAPKRKEKQY